MKKLTVNREEAEELSRQVNAPVAIVEVVHRDVLKLGESGQTIGEEIDAHLRKSTGDVATICIAFPSPSLSD